MGTYSSVKATSLKNAANNALSELGSHSLDSVKNNLSNVYNFDASANPVITDSLSNIMDSQSLTGSIAVLRKRLTNIKSAAEKIEDIQSKESTIYSYRNNSYYRDEDNKIKTYYQNQIYSLQRQISNLETQIRNLLS